MIKKWNYLPIMIDLHNNNLLQYLWSEDKYLDIPHFKILAYI